MTVGFSKQVNAFVTKAEHNAELVYKRSLVRMFTLAQLPVAQGGRMPQRTNFLRASFTVRINAPVNEVTMLPKSPAAWYPGGDEFVDILKKVKLGDEVHAAWTAKHARYQNYGTGKNRAMHFREHSLQQWGNIVRRETAQVNKR